MPHVSSHRSRVSLAQATRIGKGLHQRARRAPMERNNVDCARSRTAYLGMPLACAMVCRLAQNISLTTSNVTAVAALPLTCARRLQHATEAKGGRLSRRRIHMHKRRPSRMRTMALTTPDTNKRCARQQCIISPTALKTQTRRSKAPCQTTSMITIPAHDTHGSSCTLKGGCTDNICTMSVCGQATINHLGCAAAPEATRPSIERYYRAFRRLTHKGGH